jgi:hypothetical protein
MSYRKYKRARPAGIRIYTGGETINGMKFMGETMTCIMCGKQQPSDPTVESGWTFISIDGKTGSYVCPDELPGEGATKEQFAQAYEPILRKIASQS